MNFPPENMIITPPENTIVIQKNLRVISFDIGIKNLAYCIIDISNNIPSILDWRTVNLMDSGETPVKINYCNSPKRVLKSKSTICPVICGKKAKYQKDNCYFCETHAKTSKWIIPKKSFESSSLQKMKKESLMVFSKTFIPTIDIKKTKKEIIDELILIFKNKCLELSGTTETIQTNSKQMCLITLGINMKRILDEMPFFDGLTHVIIENQISTMASRMKTVQGQLTMYFIMKYENSQIPKIEYISSFNKLKHFTKTKPDTTINESPVISDREKYNQHKKDAIFYTREILDKFPLLINWKRVLDNKKKDDFADCFLQGVWYIDKHNITKIFT